MSLDLGFVKESLVPVSVQIAAKVVFTQFRDNFHVVAVEGDGVCVINILVTVFKQLVGFMHLKTVLFNR